MNELNRKSAAGALLDFVGYLTSGETITMGTSHDATLALDRLKVWAKERGPGLDHADVTGWNAADDSNQDATVDELIGDAAYHMYQVTRCGALAGAKLMRDLGVSSERIVGPILEEKMARSMDALKQRFADLETEIERQKSTLITR